MQLSPKENCEVKKDKEETNSLRFCDEGKKLDQGKAKEPRKYQCEIIHHNCAHGPIQESESLMCVIDIIHNQ